MGLCERAFVAEEMLEVENLPNKWTSMSATQQQETVDRLHSAAASLGLSGIELLFAKQVTWPKATNTDLLAIGGSVHVSKEDELAKFKQTVVEAVGDVDFEVESIGLAVGEQVPNVCVWTREEEDLSLLAAAEGKVCVLQCWASWSARSHTALTDFSNMAEAKEEEWSERVHLVAVGVDVEHAVMTKYLTRYGLRDEGLVRYVWAGDFQDEEEDEVSTDIPSLIRCYGLADVPWTFIIDNDGKLIFMGDTRTIQVQAAIEAALQNKAPTLQTIAPDENSWASFDQQQRRQALVSASLPLDKIRSVRLVDWVNTVLTVDGKDKRVTFNRGLTLTGVVPPNWDEEAKVVEVLRVLERQAGVNDILNSVKVLGPSVEVFRRLSVCSRCDQQLSLLEETFQCAVCVEPYALCQKCEKLSSSETSSASGEHPWYHILYRMGPHVTKDTLQTLHTTRADFSVWPAFGAKPRHVPGDKVLHSEVHCDACKRGPLEGTRYTCTTCDDFDFCDLCFAIVAERMQAELTTSQKAGSASDDDDDETHQGNHVFLKIPDSSLMHWHHSLDESDDELEGDDTAQEEAQEAEEARATETDGSPHESHENEASTSPERADEDDFDEDHAGYDVDGVIGEDSEEADVDSETDLIPKAAKSDSLAPAPASSSSSSSSTASGEHDHIAPSSAYADMSRVELQREVSTLREEAESKINLARTLRGEGKYAEAKQAEADAGQGTKQLQTVLKHIPKLNTADGASDASKTTQSEACVCKPCVIM